MSAIWLMPFWLSGVFDHCPTYTCNGSKQCWDNKRKRQADERDQEIVECTQVDIAATATRAAALKPSTAVACWHVYIFVFFTAGPEKRVLLPRCSQLWGTGSCFT